MPPKINLFLIIFLDVNNEFFLPYCVGKACIETSKKIFGMAEATLEDLAFPNRLRGNPS